MSSRKLFLTIIGVLVVVCSYGQQAALADSGHARIVRLSLVQGDVRFTRDVKGDSLSDGHANWEQAVLNLPIRQGYAVATDSGRAEVEFENGAMAFLAENTVLEFYDLSSEDGGFTTRLILRQGSAEFYVNPGRGDYFSVTGGDFSVQAETKATFRMNNFDDGSSVDVLRGRLTTLVNGKEKLLDKNQSLSVRAGEPDSMEVGRVPASDDFDQWVSGRIDSVNTATTAGLQYSNSYNYNYVSGFGDLYTYGSWFPMAGYGYCWRPYGVGFGWSPFDYGSWYYDPLFGWTFIGGQPWGWLPYHYGGWLFQPGLGWVWSPYGVGAGNVGRYRPVTGVWVHSGGTVGIVPAHPLDVRGKTPLNLSQGVFSVTPRGVSGQTAVSEPAKWRVESKPTREIMQTRLAEASAPARLSRTMGAGPRGSESAIVYDQTEHKFVNANRAQTLERSASEKADATAVAGGQEQSRGGVKIDPEQSRSNLGRLPAVPDRVNGRETSAVPNARNTPPPRPPSVPRSVASERTFSSGSGSNSSSSSRSSGWSSGSSGSTSSSSGARSSSSGSSGGGGRPH